jgi:DNA-binding transcriptional MerR regulator
MNRKLYKIGEFSKLLNVTPRTIRYYDQFGLLPQIKRSDGGIRLFDEEDIHIIKRVRLLQKEQLLPLEDIKNQLFNSENTSPQTTVILTDASCILDNYDSTICKVLPLTAHLDKPLSKNAQDTEQLWALSIKKQIIPYFQYQKTESILKTLKKLAENGVKTVFAIASSTHFQSLYPIYEELSYNTAIPLNFYPINSSAFGPGTGLLIDYIQAMIKNKKSIVEIKLSLSKTIPLLYQIGFTHSLDTFQALNILPKYPPIINELTSFCPIYQIKDGSGKLTISQCLPSYQNALDYIYNTVIELITQRKKYLYKIIVSYSFFYTEANTLCNQLKQKYLNADISLSELPASASSVLGPKSISISII